MKSGLLLLATAVLFSLGSVSAAADSLVLRDGRHVTGKFAGGTQGVIAFFSQGVTQYYNVAEVLVMTFDEEGSGQSSFDQPIAPASPNSFLHPQKGKTGGAHHAAQKTRARTRSQPASQPRLVLAVERSD